MERITRKLGGQHFNAARDLLHAGNMPAVIDILLNYYDRAYVNGLEKKKKRVVCQVAWTGNDALAFADYLVQEVSRI